MKSTKKGSLKTETDTDRQTDRQTDRDFEVSVSTVRKVQREEKQ